MKRLVVAAAAMSLGACMSFSPEPIVTPSATVVYIETAASADRLELESSRLALQMSQNPAVRSFAQMMIRDHPPMTDRLIDAAEAARITRPAPALVSHHWAALDRLRGSGANFDAEYGALQVAAHQEALGLHQAYAATGEVPQLRTVASAAVPVIEGHLRQAQALPVPPPPPVPPQDTVPPPPSRPRPGERG